MMRRVVLFLLLVAFNLSTVSAQLNEAGIFLGGSNFIGDVGKTSYIFPNSPAFGAIYKRNLSTRLAVRATYTYSKIKGDDRKSGNSFKEQRALLFENGLHELAAGIEFNFFDYNLANRKHHSTPYLFLEFAVNNYMALDFKNYKAPDALLPVADNPISPEPAVRKFSYTLPVGVGYKGRLTNSIGYSIETSFRYTFKDNLDGYFNGTTYPYRNPETGSIKNLDIHDSNGNDWYVFTGFTIVYVFDKYSRSWEHLWERNQ